MIRNELKVKSNSIITNILDGASSVLADGARTQTSHQVSNSIPSLFFYYQTLVVFKLPTLELCLVFSLRCWYHFLFMAYSIYLNLLSLKNCSISKLIDHLKEYNSSLIFFF